MASINFSGGFHLEEKLSANKNGFHWPKNPFQPGGMKSFVEKYFSTRPKKPDTSL